MKAAARPHEVGLRPLVPLITRLRIDAPMNVITSQLWRVSLGLIVVLRRSVLVLHVPGVGVINKFENVVRDIRLTEVPLLFGVMDETDNVREFLTRQFDLLTEDLLLEQDHGLCAAPHSRREGKGIHDSWHRRSVHRRCILAPHPVDGVAGDASFARKKEPSTRRVHDRHHQT